MQRFLPIPDKRGIRRQKIDQHRPHNRPTLTHIAYILMVVDRPEPNSDVECEIARDPPWGAVGAWGDGVKKLIKHHFLKYIEIICFSKNTLNIDLK